MIALPQYSSIITIEDCIKNYRYLEELRNPKPTHDTLTVPVYSSLELIKYHFGVFNYKDWPKSTYFTFERIHDQYNIKYEIINNYIQKLIMLLL